MIIGIIGGGQLGMMMAESAVKMKHRVIAIDSNEDAPIRKFCSKFIHADFSDKTAYEKLYSLCDVITYEFENVDLELIKKFQDRIPQKALALEISKNRLLEKDFARNLGIATPKYELFDPHKNHDYPILLKTMTMGYDGKGQYIIKNPSQIRRVPNLLEIPYIQEEIIDFDYEISVIVTRDQFKKTVVFPIPINRHVNGILHTSFVSEPKDNDVWNQASEWAVLIADRLDYVGTLAVEFFVKGKQVLFNEFAPRPHNSGHYTIEGCDVSQFTNHILAITGESVIEPSLLNVSLMVNILGQNLDYVAKAGKYKGTHIHLYGKKEPREDRKIGHITITSPDYETIYQAIIKE